MLKLRAVHLALKHFLPYLRGRHVLIRSDSISKVYHINHVINHGGPNKGSALSKQHLSHWVMDVITHAYMLANHRLPPGMRCHSTRSKIHIMGGPEGHTPRDHLSCCLMVITKHNLQVLQGECGHSSSIGGGSPARILTFCAVRYSFRLWSQSSSLFL